MWKFCPSPRTWRWYSYCFTAVPWKILTIVLLYSIQYIRCHLGCGHFDRCIECPCNDPAAWRFCVYDPSIPCAYCKKQAHKMILASSSRFPFVFGGTVQTAQSWSNCQNCMVFPHAFCCFPQAVSWEFTTRAIKMLRNSPTYKTLHKLLHQSRDPFLFEQHLPVLFGSWKILQST